MITTTASNATKTLLLTPKESEALLELLDQAVPGSQPANGSNVLLTARDKLDDAAGIAQWLRENATCELTLPEFHAVAELLDTHPVNVEGLKGIPCAVFSAW